MRQAARSWSDEPVFPAQCGEPKPGYVAGWADLPAWQWEADAEIFERTEQTF
ncbi:hypothetical protein [Streptomyces sp. NPDC018352]|uniref:hypothetical protein n=1 Tax=Streptomyces sp. NPDC018352 TaxID=3157194 RepID=UPI0034045AB6